MEKKLCLFVGCQKHTQNWRTNYCCPAHRRSHAGSLGGNAAKDIPKKQYKLPKPVKPKAEPKPKKTKEEIAAYHRQWAIEKQKRTKRATPKWADKDNIRAIYEEAIYCGLPGMDQETVTASNDYFAELLGEVINEPLSVIHEHVKENYGLLLGYNAVASYNYDRLYLAE